MTNKVLNCHHFGGVKNLPEDARYIGRPSIHGNPFSSKKDDITREESVASHRIYLYTNLINVPDYFDIIKRDLLGYDLACWCKNEKNFVCCHGDNLLHVLHPDRIDRDYKKSLFSYLVDDVQIALKSLTELLRDPADFFDGFVINELRCGLNDVLTKAKDKAYPIESFCLFLAKVAVDLEAAIGENKKEGRSFRLDHALWEISRLCYGQVSRAGEPIRGK